MVTARKIGKRYFQEKSLSLSALFGVDRADDFLQLLFVVLLADLFQHGARFIDALLFREPARAARNSEEQHEEQQSGQRGDGKLPAPFVGAKIEEADDVVRKIGEQDAEDDVELKQTDEPAAIFRRSEFGDIGRAQYRRAADAEAADEAEENQRGPAPGEGAAQR